MFLSCFVYIQGEPKTETLPSLREISAKRWPKIVKFGIALTAYLLAFLLKNAENYRNTWSRTRTNTTGISFTHTDVT